MSKRFFISLFCFDLAICLYFATWSAFFSVQIAFLANLIIPYITYLNIKKKLAKFVVAQKPRFFIRNTVYFSNDEFKPSFKQLKNFKYFMNLYKFLAYLIFSICIIALINNKLFDIFAFFIACFVVLANILFEKLVKSEN